MKYLIFSLLISAFLLALPAAGMAQQRGLTCASDGTCQYTPLEPIPGVNQTGNSTDFQALVQGVFRILFSVGALIAVGRLVAGGIMYMTSEIVDKKSEARKWMSSSIYGLILLAGSWLILYTINPKLLQFTFTLPSDSQSSFNARFSPGTDTTVSTQNEAQIVASYCSKNGGGTPHSTGTDASGKTKWECVK